MTDPYDWWRRAVASPALIGSDLLPVHDGHPQCGFYRLTGKAGLVPVAFFEQGGKIVALMGEEWVDPVTLWLSCCRNPVSEDAYRNALVTGEWPDVDPHIKPTAPAPLTTVAPPPIGHNAPKDKSEERRDEINTALEGVKAYDKIDDDETAARAQSLRSRLLELAGASDKERAAEKEPHWEACKAVDGKWMPFIKAAQAGADKIRDALSAFETRKAKAAREAQAKAEAERQEAERKAREAAARGAPAPTPPPPSPEPVPQPKAQIKGGVGRAAAVRVFKVVKGIEDVNKAWAWALNTYPDECHELLIDLAQQAVKNGHDAPGFKIEEERRVA